MKEKIYKYINIILILIGIFVFFLLSLFSIRYNMLGEEYYSEKLMVVKDSIFLNILSFIILSAFVYLIAFLITRNNKNNYRKAHILSIIVSFLIFFIGIYIVKNFHVLPGGDQAFLYTNASLLLEGSYDHLCTGSYMDMYPHQYPISLFYELLFHITGAWNYESIQYVYTFFAGVISYFGFHLCHELFENEKVDIIYSLLIMMCLPLYFYTTFVYGEIPSIAFLILSLWMLTSFIKKRKLQYGILFGIFMVLSMLFRKHSMVFLIACILVLLVYFWKNKDFSFVFICIGTVLLYFISTQSINVYIQNISGFEVGKGIPAIAHITMGMTDNEGGPGRYNGYNQYIFGLAEYDTELAASLSKNDLNIRLEEFKENPAVFLDFMKRKFMNQWNDPTYESIVITDSFADEGVPNTLRDKIYYGEWYEKIVGFMNRYQFTLYFGAFLFFILILSKEKHLYKMILFICILGEFLFSFIWEAKGRYVFPCYICIIPIAAVGIALLYEKAVNLVKNLV